eukprot:scaffold46172_cov31-Tisochrysis_lutea.AAC.3
MGKGAIEVSCCPWALARIYGISGNTSLLDNDDRFAASGLEVPEFSPSFDYQVQSIVRPALHERDASAS